MLARYGTHVQAQAVVSQSSFYSCNDPRLHFGLGTAREAEIEIFWPSGVRETVHRIAANQLVTIREGAGVIPNRGWSR